MTLEMTSASWRGDKRLPQTTGAVAGKDRLILHPHAIIRFETPSVYRAWLERSPNHERPSAASEQSPLKLLYPVLRITHSGAAALPEGSKSFKCSSCFRYPSPPFLGTRPPLRLALPKADLGRGRWRLCLARSWKPGLFYALCQRPAKHPGRVSWWNLQPRSAHAHLLESHKMGGIGGVEGSSGIPLTSCLLNLAGRHLHLFKCKSCKCAQHRSATKASLRPGGA